MDSWILWTLIAVVLIVLVVIIVVWWSSIQNPYSLMNWWNSVIDNECTIQDSVMSMNTPQVYPAEEFPQSNIRDLDREIKVNHDAILKEAISYMNDNGGVAMIDMDNVQSQFIGQRGWRPLWVKFVNGWAAGSDRLPTLKRIVEKIPGITLLHVSVMHPGTELAYHNGISRSVYRYHYGLSIPEGDLGMKIYDDYIRWENRKGFVWDDTRPHTSWNKSDTPRLIIFADIKRDLGRFYNIGTNIIFWMVSRCNHTKEAANVIRNHVKNMKAEHDHADSHNLQEMLN